MLEFIGLIILFGCFLSSGRPYVNRIGVLTAEILFTTLGEPGLPYLTIGLATL